MRTNRHLLWAALLAAGCASRSPATQPPSPPQPVVLGAYEGEIDPVAGTFSIRTVSTQGESGPDLMVIEGGGKVTIANNGTPTGPEAPIQEPGHAVSCSGVPTVTQGYVRMTLAYPSPMFAGALYAENTWVSSSGAEACNSDAAPDGLSSTYGLWSYGSVQPGRATSDRLWQFRYPAGQKVSFRGRVLGVPGTTFTTGMPTPNPGNNEPLVAYGRESVIYATTSAGLATVSLAGVLQGTQSLGTAQNAISIAYQAGATAADDLTWFVTDTDRSGNWPYPSAYVGVVHQGTAYAIQGGGTSLSGIVADPTHSRRAWFLTRDDGWFRSVTFDPAGAGQKLTLGAKVVTPLSPDGASQPYAMAFGPPPHNWIYVGGNSNFTARLSYIAAYDTSGAYQGQLPLAGSLCTHPYQFTWGPDGKLWFGYGFDQTELLPWASGVCVYDPSPGDFTGTVTPFTTDRKIPYLGVARSVNGAGNAVWGALQDWTSLVVTYTEYVPGKSTSYTVGLVETAGFSPSIAGSPAVTGSTSYDAYLWAPTKTGLRRIQPQ